MVKLANQQIYIIGAGLAGCEAAWQLTKWGCRVVLYEMKPHQFSPAHRSPNLAELVCSNSLRSNNLENAAGLLKEEMRRLNSLIIHVADTNKIPAGHALAVDRKKFSQEITNMLDEDGRVTIIREEVRTTPEDGIVIVASGPLTSEVFSLHLKQLIGDDFLYFHDAISPIIEAESIDHDNAFKASRYNRGTADYINCPLSREEYYHFVKELLASEKSPLKDFEKLIPYEGCMPVEVMAERGVETLAHGPMKPVGLLDPSSNQQPYAVVQLRQENKEATLYNMVGFQTRLKWSEQKRVFSLIPALKNAKFLRYGSLHRNTFIHSPSLLLRTLQLKKTPHIFFAGQITGVEGYVESAAMGLLAGIQASRYVRKLTPLTPPRTSMIGALLAYITSTFSSNFQPMNANFGLLPPLEYKAHKRERKNLLVERALKAIEGWKKGLEI
jgi:methylenetetrahydrofolate--tRNA-(uracil-5-)-methyltransferase